MTERLNVIARIKPHARHIDDARAAICGIIDRTRAEPGCIEFRLSEDEADGALYLYEEWRDEAALNEHHAKDYTRDVFAAYQNWLAEEPQIRHLTPVC